MTQALRSDNLFSRLAHKFTLEEIAFFWLLFAIAFLPISKACVEIGTCSALGFWFLDKILRRKPIFPRQWFIPVYLIFLFIVLVSLVNVPKENLGTGLRGVLKWLQLLGVFMVSYDLFQDRKKAKLAAAVLIGSMILVSINGYFQLVTGTGFLRHRVLDPGRIIRMKSSLGAANSLAAFFLITLPLTFSLLVQSGQSRTKKLFYGLTLLFFFSAFVWTFSRSAFIAFAASILLYLILKRHWKTAAVILAGAAIILLASPGIRKQIVPTFHQKDHSVHERVQFWNASLDLIKQKPWLGHGVNQYLRVFPTVETHYGEYRGYAHNSYLQMGTEIGIFGLLVFLIPFFAYAAGRVKKGLSPKNHFPPDEMILIGLVAFCIQALFDNHFYAFEIGFLFWIFWGMLLAMKKESTP